MADLMPGIPSVPGDETSWTNFVDQFETLKKGDIPLSLTNWDDLTLVPSIAAGAGIEIAGATYRFTTESLISDEAGLVAGTVYVVIKTADPTVNEATAYFTNVAPEWRDDLNGWYDTTGENRYTGHVMAWDGAAAYTNKRVFTVGGPGGDVVTVGAGGDLTAGEITSGTITAHDGVNAGDVILKTRVLTGVLPSGTTVNIPHGLTGAGIRCFFVSVAASSAWWRATTSSVDCHSWDNTNLIIEKTSGFDGLPFTITIWYEA